MKLLFVLLSPEFLRYYDSTIDLLAERGHDVALALNHRRERKAMALERLTAVDRRVRMLDVAPSSSGVWPAIADGLRGLMDFVRFLDPRFSDAPALRERMKWKAAPVGFRWLDRLPSLSPASVRRLVRFLARLEQAVPLDQEVLRFLREHQPDLVIVSPLVDAASKQVDYLKAAKALGIPSVACIASWDNLTNKGLLRIEPDRVVVWNEAQREEAVAYHDIRREKVVVTGAQLFDRWFTARPTRTHAEFCARVGLPNDAPFVLFTGSSSFISESNAEVEFVRRWAAALRQSGDPALSQVNILVRPHPYNCHAWPTASGLDSRMAVYPNQTYSFVHPDNRIDFYDSLFHSAAVVGVNTSAMIEAAIIGRPVLSLHVPEFARTQEGTLHFHHLLPENGGFLSFATTLDEHVRQLADRLRNPEASAAEARRFVSSFIRPHGIDRPATPIIADVLVDAGSHGLHTASAPPPWGLAARFLLLGVAACTAIPSWWQREDGAARTRKRFGRLVARTSARTYKTLRRLLLIARDRPRRYLKRLRRWLARTGLTMKRRPSSR